MFSRATDHQLLRMKPICRPAKCNWSPACFHTLHCSGVSDLAEQKAREDALARGLHARDELPRAHFDHRSLLDGAVDLRRDAIEALALGGDVRLLGGSLAAGGAPSWRSESALRRAACAACRSLPWRCFRSSRCRCAVPRGPADYPGTARRFFSAASMAVCRLLTGLTISSTDGPLALGTGGGACSFVGAAGTAAGAGAAAGPGVTTGAAGVVAGAFAAGAAARGTALSAGRLRCRCGGTGGGRGCCALGKGRGAGQRERRARVRRVQHGE